MKYLNLVFLIGSFVTMTGCQDIRSKLGIEHESPDEYAVTPSHQPLEMPPDFFVLPSPQSDSSKKNKASVVSYQRIENEPLEKEVSLGQKVILEKIGANQGEESLRQQLDDEAKLENVRGQGLLERFNVVKKKPAKGDLLNPHEEADRLKEQGLPDSRDKQSTNNKESQDK